MNFFFSHNEEVKKYIDPRVGKLKTGGNYAAFNDNWEAWEGTIYDVEDFVSLGEGLCAWHLVKGKRTKNETGCIQAGLIIIDVDNQADGKDANGNKIQKQELDVAGIDDLEICKKYLSLAYYSPSHTEEWPRFRLVFGLEKPIIDTQFYQWFTRQIAQQIPGADVRATQVPNLFYGCKNKGDIICVTDKFIPSNKIDEGFRAFVTIPKSEESLSDPQKALELDVDPEGIPLTQLLSRSVQGILDGEAVDDRSSTMAMAFKEIIGWANWVRQNNVPVSTAPLDVANRVFYAIYEYSSELDGKFSRI
jgi:hypothetical protein